MADTFGERVQCGVARLLARLPDRVKIALSGEPPIVVDGQRLDPYVQLLRSIRLRRGFTSLIAPSIEAGRVRFRREARIFRGPMTKAGSVRDFAIPGPAGAIGVRHYAATADGERRPPLMVYLHGGGFVIGDLDTHDEPCRLLCRHGGTHVLSVDYRLAPEHPFPAALDDAQAVFDWAVESAASLGADPSCIAVGGDSAGANLAAVVALADRRVAAQLLIYPSTDATEKRRSRELFGEGFLLTERDRHAFYEHYVPQSAAQPDDWRLSPLKAATLPHAPPALVVVAGFDILRDEGEAYADALQRAGVSVRVLRFPGLEHGFIHLTGIHPAARRAMRTIGEEWATVVHASRG